MLFRSVKVTHSRVRRKRMGHINLAAPVVHIWFFKSMPSRLGTLLGMKTSDIEKIIYYQDYVVTDPGDTELTLRQVLTEEEHREALDSSVPEAIDHYLANYAELLEKWDSVLEEKGVQKVEIADSEIEAFRAKAADPIREKWIADMEAQGLPGQELYDLVISTLEEHRGGS